MRRAMTLMTLVALLGGLKAPGAAAFVTKPPPPPSADSDGDGLTDSEELLLGTNPFNPDTDGDGLSDGQEVCCTRPTRWWRTSGLVRRTRGSSSTPRTRP